MKSRALCFLLLALLVAGCGADGAEKFKGDPGPVDAAFAPCSFCHNEQATTMTFDGGHGRLNVTCEVCHQDLTPGEVGPGHRSVPACADCHTAEETHHDPAVGTTKECVQCHTPHGSPNLLLVQEEITTPGGETQPVEFTNLEGRADGSFASASDPGTGICEICHTTTLFYRSDGLGEPHFAFPCTLCHLHSDGFAPPHADPTFGSCAFCHEARAKHMVRTGGHGSLDVKCQLCHQDLTPGKVGPDHRSIPVCADCHTAEETHHDPAVGTAKECIQCHTPHGSMNLSLVQEEIVIPSGMARDVEFTNREGRADGSFASASDPGTGICEICHTTTEFYRSDGSGEEHFTLPCIACHLHKKGFLP